MNDTNPYGASDAPPAHQAADRPFDGAPQNQGPYGYGGPQQNQYGYGQPQPQGQNGYDQAQAPGQHGYTPGPPNGAYGYAQPQGQFGPGFTAMPQAVPFATYGSRVGAYLIDGLIATIPFIVIGGLGLWLAFKDTYKVPRPDGTTDLEGFNGSGFALVALSFLVGFLVQLWNRGFRQGRTGQSIGKKTTHIKVVDQRTGQPTGAGAGAGRFGVEFGFGLVNSIVGILSLLDLLWPLWDDNKQAIHDKVVHTVVVQGD